MYIDTHCHLNFDAYDTDRAMVIGNAKKAGVKQFIVPGVDIWSSQQAIALTQKNPGVIYAAIGIHPYEAQHDWNVHDLDRLMATYSNRTIQHYNDIIVAIGECGLDYHLYKGEAAVSRKDYQKKLFEAELRLALAHNLPVIIHCRDAFDDLYSVLDRLPSMPRGVIHCFGGGLADIRYARDRKLYVGIDGNVTYSKTLRTIVPDIPLSMLLLETDAPLLTPAPHRGTRNEPKYIPLIAKHIAELMHVTLNEVKTATAKNAECLFGLPPH